MNLYDVESDFYDLFYFDFQDDIEVYRRHSCGRVLEFMTGTGRILYYLNPPYGVGVDINDNMLEGAKKNLRGRNVRLVKGDVRDVALGEKFCLIIIGYNSILMFPREDRIKILKNAARHLSEDGKIMIDIVNPYMMVEGIVHHGATVEKDGVYYSRFFVPRWMGDRWEILYFYDIVERENVRRRYASLNLYPLYSYEVEEEARAAGLIVKEIYGDYDFSEFEENSERIIAVLVRDNGGNKEI